MFIEWFIIISNGGVIIMVVGDFLIELDIVVVGVGFGGYVVVICVV